MKGSSSSFLIPLVFLVVLISTILFHHFWPGTERLRKLPFPLKSKDHFCHTRRPIFESETELRPKIYVLQDELEKYIASRKKYFITYGDEKYASLRLRVAKMANASKFFDFVKIYTDALVPSSFKVQFKDVISRKRGGGYWLWKFYIVNETMSTMDWGDFLVYLDADCAVEPTGGKRFQDYLKFVNVSRSGSLSFSYQHPERYWTTDRLFEEMGLLHNMEFWDSTHLTANLLIFQKTNQVIRLLRMWKSVIYSDPLISSDYYNNQTTRGEFREHRHDQSILSLIRKCLGTVAIPYNQIKNSLDNKSPFRT